MRKSATCLTSLALLACSGAAPALDAQAGLYYEIPLGGVTAKQSKPKLSLRLDRTRREGLRTVEKRAILDLRFGARGVEALKLRGRDLLD